jgi:preprotein translocase subunit SecY
MCMFCAAIPATAAVGAKLNAKQQAETREAQAGGGEAQTKPIKVLTAGAIVVLAACSLLYHSHFNSLI